MEWPDAEVLITEQLLRTLLDEQHPDLSACRLVEARHGWDNANWRLGDSLQIRLPRRAEAVPLLRHEQRWLPELAPRLTLPVPVPSRLGHPGPHFPWPWSVVPWFDAIPGSSSPSRRTGDVARSLGAFLHSLHEAAPPEAPRNPFRGVPIRDRSETLERWLATVGADVNELGVRAAWGDALDAAPWDREPVWIHGDLHPANLLFGGGDLVAVVDFGDMCGGDPATDLAGGWMLLPPDAIPAFLSAYGEVDSDLIRRARGWAILFGLMFVAIGRDGRRDYARLGHAAIETVLREARLEN